MGFRIKCKEDIHLSALEDCPTSVQKEFRDALVELKQSSVKSVNRAEFDFLSRVDGYPQYRIEASDNGTEYVILFEIERTQIGRQNIIYILTIGEHNNLID
jgi:hypothetical protein